MSQALNNTTESYNNNDNCFNRNDSSFNTSTYNSTTYNYTTSDDRYEILAWLSPLEPRERHRDIGPRRIDSIGTWLLETEEFKRWHSGSSEDALYHPTLFCDGNPGAGKSYITSLVIDKLCDEAVEEDPTVAYFYFDFTARNEQSPVNMLGSLLSQLVSGEGGIPEVIARDFRKAKMSRGPQVSGILRMFREIIATRRTFICVDALDECVPEHRNVVLESLREILQGSPNTRLFMTGRPHVRSEVGRGLSGTAKFIFIRATEDGVVRLLREKLRKDTVPDIMSTTLEEDIIGSILAIASETFLLASLHIEAILRGTTAARRRKTLQSIKDGAGLRDAYDATLERIKDQDEEKSNLALATLAWICHSERPLHVDELCHALAVETGETDFDPENAHSIGTLLNCCQGLITVDAEASTVHLIHYTVKEYLCSYPSLFSKPHSALAETCLTYLNSRQVKNRTSQSRPDHGSMPFLKYSARYWGTHMNKELSDCAKTLALELLNQYEDHMSAISLFEQVLHPRDIGGIATSLLFSGLHCASFFGSVELVTVLVDAEGCNINQQDCAGRTPLAWAARGGHEGVVKVLLERKNVDLHLSDKNGEWPFGLAVINGHKGLVKLFLEHGNSLEWAATKGHEGVVKLLLERENVDPNRPGMNGEGLLGWAATNGHEGVVKLLLEREDVDLNLLDKAGDGPPVCAALAGHEGVVKLLLGRGDVDPNLPDKDGDGPLMCAVINEHEGVVKLLLERDHVDPNRRNSKSRAPLTFAATGGDEGVVKLLLEREDLDLNLPDKDGDGPLMCAAINGHEGVVKLLLERKDVDPNRRGGTGMPPLSYAALRGYEGVVKLLLEREDVDPDRGDIFGITPRTHATWNGHPRIVQLLEARIFGETSDPGARRRRKRDVLTRGVFSVINP